jgi:hypothetical protein
LTPWVAPDRVAFRFERRASHDSATELGPFRDGLGPVDARIAVADVPLFVGREFLASARRLRSAVGASWKNAVSHGKGADQCDSDRLDASVMVGFLADEPGLSPRRLWV